MMNFNLDGRIFRSVANSATGEVSEATVFRYRQEGMVVWATYAGGAIRYGQLVAVVIADGSLDMRYHHVNTAGALMTGLCRRLRRRYLTGGSAFASAGNGRQATIPVASPSSKK